MSKIVNISKAKKKTKSKGFFLGFIFIVAVICFLLVSPVFQIKRIMVEGVLRLSKNSIVDSSGLYYGQNIWRIDKKAIEDSIKRVSYVDSVSIRRAWPDGIVLHIVESDPIAELEFYGSKLMIDENAKLLEVVTDNVPTNFPSLVGFTVNEIVLGEKICANEGEKLEDFLEVLKMLKGNDMLEKVTKVTENEGILVHFENGHVANFGDAGNLPYKMSVLNAILEKEETASYIDITKKVTKPVWGMFDNSTAGGATSEE